MFAAAWRRATDCTMAVCKIWSLSMRAMSSGHTNWNSKYFEQLRCAYMTASRARGLGGLAVRLLVLAGKAAQDAP